MIPRAKGFDVASSNSFSAVGRGGVEVLLPVGFVGTVRAVCLFPLFGAESGIRSVNYDKTVFILIHVRRAEVHARAGWMGLRTGECGAMRGYGGGGSSRRSAARDIDDEKTYLSELCFDSASDSSEQQHSDSRAVGRSPPRGGSGAGAGAGGAVFLRHGSERDDGDGDVE
ncbi:hypothetical protein EVAR_52558_1 [Eumeta japonica]|uniref:Uncharacterized protein n=1 Tax=Eumeta variegata TaxID=151549 RepID=A0A4C1ZP22_EUMVA|nr:hypothetical protein EVAR_52558_1 [Eumeta japonica]